MSAPLRNVDTVTPRAAAAVAFQHELAALHEDRARLKSEVARLERHVSELAIELATADEKVGDLQKLILAAQRLDACADRAAVLEALRDIVITVIGSDDFVILAMDDDGCTLWPILGVGQSGAACGPLLVTDDLVATAFRSGRRVIAPPRGASGGPARADTVACVPLTSGSRKVGMLVLFTLLAHRAELRRNDVDVLDFLSAHAATALQIADLRAAGLRRPVSLL
jgi:GAF domain-containing protein